MLNSTIDFEDKQQPPENLTLLKILNYVPIFILLIGIIGNAFSFLIFLKLGKFKFTFKKFKSYFVNTFRQCMRKKKKDKLKKDDKVSNGVFTVYIYLATLAVFDLSVLFFGLANDWLTDLRIYNFKLYSSSFCKSISFLAFFSSHFSSWLLVFVSFIRLLAIYSPFNATKLTKTKSVRRVCFILMLILTAFNLHLYWNMEIKEIDRVEYLSESLKESMMIQGIDQDIILNKTLSLNETNSNQAVDESIWKYECKIKKNFFTQNVWPIADKLVYCFLPFSLLLVINSIIVLNIKKSQNYKYILYVSKLISPNGHGIDSYSGCDIELENLTDKIKNIKINELNGGNIDNKTMNFLKKLSYLTEDDKNLKSSKKSKPFDAQKINRLRTIEIKEKIIKYKKYHLIGRKFTFMLLGISFAFLILTLPIVVIYAFLGKIEKYIESLSDLNKSIAMYEILNVAQKISYLLMYLNHSINFFIYFTTSARFRRIFFTDYFCDIKCRFQMRIRNFVSRKKLNRSRNRKEFLYA
jgi:hypothetical protein